MTNSTRVSFADNHLAVEKKRSLDPDAGRPFCALRAAKRARRRYAEEDYQGSCRLESCEGCGPDKSRQWAKDHRLKGEVIRSPMLAFVLTFKRFHKLPSRSDHGGVELLIEDVIEQQGALERALAVIDGRNGGQVPGWLAVSHFGLHQRKNLSHHVHIGMLYGKENRVAADAKLKKLRKMGEQGGYEIAVDAKRTPSGPGQNSREPSTLSGLLRYLGHEPFRMRKPGEKKSSDFTKEGLIWVEDVLVRPWRAKMSSRQPLCIRKIGGKALSAQGFRKARAYARLQWVSPKVSMKTRLKDADIVARGYLDAEGLKLRHVVVCSKCQKFIVPLQDLTGVCTQKLKGEVVCGQRWTDAPMMTGNAFRKELKKNWADQVVAQHQESVRLKNAEALSAPAPSVSGKSAGGLKSSLRLRLQNAEALTAQVALSAVAARPAAAKSLTAARSASGTGGKRS